MPKVDTATYNVETLLELQEELEYTAINYGRGASTSKQLRDAARAYVNYADKLEG